MLERAFRVSEYAPRTPFTAAGLRVTAVPVEHYDIEAYGFRVEGERVLAYSGDTGPCDALAELARDADLFVCEATLERADLDGPERGHLAADEAAAAAELAGAKRLLLTHRPQELVLPGTVELVSDGYALDF
jgi:ribonuclease BN (tRNA processing enzyme)